MITVLGDLMFERYFEGRWPSKALSTTVVHFDEPSLGGSAFNVAAELSRREVDVLLVCAIGRRHTRDFHKAVARWPVLKTSLVEHHGPTDELMVPREGST